MTTQEVLKRICTGKIILNLCSHNPGYEGTVEYFKEYLKLWEDGANGLLDGKWNIDKKDNIENVNKRMREHFQSYLSNPVNESTNFCISPFDIRAKCSNCGKALSWVLNSKTETVELSATINLNSLPRFTVKEEDTNCPYSKLESIKSSIQVNSPLIFANYFNFPDSPKEEQYKDEWSLNTLIGRKNITEFKSKLNVAYGQMGNMAIAIYFNEELQEIIITSPYALEAGYMEDEVKENKIIETRSHALNGFKELGTISLPIWRWEATDLNTLTQSTLDLMKKESNQDIIEVEVKHGTWAFEHYYDVKDYNEIKDEDLFIYARLKLV